MRFCFRQRRVIEFGGSKKNNIVIKYYHGIAVIKDLHETDPQKRYKAILARTSRSSVWFSPDGLHWGEERRVAPIDNGDTYNCVFWDPALKKLRSWTFDSEGGFFNGLWTKDGNQWLLTSAGVKADGGSFA